MCDVENIAIYAKFMQFYALSCGEKLSPTVHLWRKKWQIWGLFPGCPTAQISRVHTPPGVTRASRQTFRQTFSSLPLQQSTRHTLFSLPLKLHARKGFWPCVYISKTLTPIMDLVCKSLSAWFMASILQTMQQNTKYFNQFHHIFRWRFHKMYF